MHAGLLTFDTFGIGAKAPKTSIFDASRLQALNMNSPRQSLGKSQGKKTSLKGLNHKAVPANIPFQAGRDFWNVAAARG
jgi:hypothetical protein